MKCAFPGVLVSSLMTLYDSCHLMTVEPQALLVLAFRDEGILGDEQPHLAQTFNCRPLITGFISIPAVMVSHLKAFLVVSSSVPWKF